MEYNFKFNLREEVFFIHEDRIKKQRIYGVTTNVNQRIECYSFIYQDSHKLFMISATDCHKSISDLTKHHEEILNPLSIRSSLHEG